MKNGRAGKMARRRQSRPYTQVGQIGEMATIEQLDSKAEVSCNGSNRQGKYQQSRFTQVVVQGKSTRSLQQRRATITYRRQDAATTELLDAMHLWTGAALVMQGFALGLVVTATSTTRAEYLKHYSREQNV